MEVTIPEVKIPDTWSRFEMDPSYLRFRGVESCPSFCAHGWLLSWRHALELKLQFLRSVTSFCPTILSLVLNDKPRNYSCSSTSAPRLFLQTDAPCSWKHPASVFCVNWALAIRYPGRVEIKQSFGYWADRCDASCRNFHLRL